MDLMRPASTEAAEQLVTEYSSGEPEILRTDFYNSLLAAYSREELETQLADTGLENLKVEIISDRHFIVWGKR